ncbi:MAG: hypothetical protein WC575_02000 [Patescibacteria group bacterium]
MPTTYIWLGLIILALLLWILFATLFSIRFKRKKGKDYDSDDAMLGGVAVALIGVFILRGIIGLITSQTFPAQSFLVTSEGKILATFEEESRLWNWDKRLEGIICLSYAPIEQNIVLNLHPVTKNPKVLNLQYTIRVLAGGTPEAIMTQQCITKKYGGLQEFIEFHLYEFNREHGGECVAFDNPRDYEQQTKFQSLIKSFLEPRLVDTEIKFQDAYFLLN